MHRGNLLKVGGERMVQVESDAEREYMDRQELMRSTHTHTSCRAAIPELLAVVVPGASGGRGTETYDKNPKIADYPSGEWVFWNLFLYGD